MHFAFTDQQLRVPRRGAPGAGQGVHAPPTCAPPTTSPVGPRPPGGRRWPRWGWSASRSPRTTAGSDSAWSTWSRCSRRPGGWRCPNRWSRRPPWPHRLLAELGSADPAGATRRRPALAVRPSPRARSPRRWAGRRRSPPGPAAVAGADGADLFVLVAARRRRDPEIHVVGSDRVDGDPGAVPRPHPASGRAGWTPDTRHPCRLGAGGGRRHRPGPSDRAAVATAAAAARAEPTG